MSESKRARIALSTGYTSGEIRAESKKAVLVDFYGIEKWLPKSQVEIKDSDDNEYEVDVVPVEWLVEEIERELGEAY